ncbi:MAG TPA: GrpB family protein [Phototrophicaceae bacterium]|nr:GrpB family protein [Phototrophicaceae bacterium]
MTDGQRVSLVASRHAEWAARFGELVARLEDLVPGAVVEHIGSTSVPGLPAKDVVDVLVGVAAADVEPVARRFAAAGLDLEGTRAHHCWLSLPDRTARTAVVHVVEHGGRAWDNRVSFRDLLRRDAAARQAYLRVKEDAARQTENWDDYTQAKTAVVAELLAAARRGS